MGHSSDRFLVWWAKFDIQVRGAEFPPVILSRAVDIKRDLCGSWASRDEAPAECGAELVLVSPCRVTV